jgi:uncharacterized Zn finger protein
MERLEFMVLGGQGDEYRVVFEASGDNLSAFCTCPAGLNGQYCKHRFALMDGEYDQLVSRNEADLSRVKLLMKGSDLETAYKAVLAAEPAHSEAKRRLAAAKQKLAKAMYR